MKTRLLRLIKLGISFSVLYLVSVAAFPRIPLIKTSTEKKVYIAFGFHVNLYHSFRGDTNDNDGFGRDIRVIRNTLQTLDNFNKQGVKVKAVWDIENAFSLQDKLPRYAPDIIKNIRRRVHEHGDEIIAMSYNNGLMSAMTKQEFSDSISLAISNRWGSGIQDLFGKYSPIVRPQEMMVSPGNYRLYQEHGIDTIALYYSGVNFDAFRVFVRELSKKEAHNPLWYVNKRTGEKMRLLPTYNIGDLVENVSLADWAQKLHRLQRRGRIDSDVIIFINFDGDDFFWEGLGLPPYLSWLPNTGGLQQLVDSVKDLPYVEFTTLQSYLDEHPPVGEVSFQQDLADGSFNGYNSWSEKSSSSVYWSELIKNRNQQKKIEKIFSFLQEEIPPTVQKQLDNSYHKRLRLLSTTNYGMATPFIAREREQSVERLIKTMKHSQEQAWQWAQEKIRQNLDKSVFPPQLQNHSLVQKIFVAQPTRYLKTALPPKTNLQARAKEIFLLGQNGERFLTRLVQEHSNGTDVVLASETSLPMGIYALYEPKKELFRLHSAAKIKKAKKLSLPATVQTKNFTITFNQNGHVMSLQYKGKEKLLKDSFVPMLEYRKNFFLKPKQFEIEDHSTANALDIRMSADWSVDAYKQLQKGKVFLHLTSWQEHVYVHADIHYPETTRDHVIKRDSPMLIRKIDWLWQQASPLPLFLSLEGDNENMFQINKENYLHVHNSYLLDYHRHHRKNQRLDNVNNHITAAYVGVANNAEGMVAAYDATVLANFAGMPIKVDYLSQKAQVGIFPFSAIFGRQYFQPTWGTKNGIRSAFYTGQQFSTAASTYNGFHYKFSLRLSWHEGRELPSSLRADAKDYSNSLQTINLFAFAAPLKNKDHSHPPRGLVAGYSPQKQGLYFHWERPPHHFYWQNADKNIVIELGQNKNNVERVQFSAQKNTVFVSHFQGKPVGSLQHFYARAAFLENGKQTAFTPFIYFFTQDHFERENPLPLSLQLSVLWDTLLSYIN